MFPRLSRLSLLALAALGSGCASLPPERGTDLPTEWITQRGLPAPSWPSDDGTVPEPAVSSSIETIDLDLALDWAFVHHPAVAETYARLGISRAELDEARRLANPRFDFARLSASEGEAQITRGLSFGLSDWLMQPLRKRFAEGELKREQLHAAQALWALAGEVEAAWIEAVAAQQVAQMRALVLEAASASAEFAERLFAAGNLAPLQLEQERAEAISAGIGAAEADTEALTARHRLALLTGLPFDDSWQLPEQLPAPLSDLPTAGELVERLVQERLDLLAAKEEVRLREDALGVTRRWRWLGELEFEYEWESEADGAGLRGPGLSLELPLFSQGQPAITRAKAELLIAKTELNKAIRQGEREVRTALAAMQLQQRIVQRYREALLPAREAIVRRTQEEVNFMLVGVFELLAAKREQFDAYQAYLQAIRDYWLARGELTQAVGARWADEGEHEPVLGIDSVLPPPSEGGHQGHQGHQGQQGHTEHSTQRSSEQADHSQHNPAHHGHEHHGETQ
ncbi:TolC family protein [Pseudomarimonas arenosa]|uniref:TolC family protein n=1 Tax=Pseudomarimonas arenosa TaxID=2774145 RepID=A0AAW3ZHP6_9GAMM|nr:TolC family protein [Pseudomarimonas arenosa]MBD8524264.1 TolC family protein [Pseudomarimonas arenosa]